ncbi:hypothetical protein MPSEU_000060400 [Mayamaea pseudoterrestris]|nr:hypothetical protein MPSEU_000060400 [Mayamaea pseudoterrestris]
MSNKHGDEENSQCGQRLPNEMLQEASRSTAMRELLSALETLRDPSTSNSNPGGSAESNNDFVFNILSAAMNIASENDLRDEEGLPSVLPSDLSSTEHDDSSGNFDDEAKHADEASAADNIQLNRVDNGDDNEEKEDFKRTENGQRR